MEIRLRRRNTRITTSLREIVTCDACSRACSSACDGVLQMVLKERVTNCIFEASVKRKPVRKPAVIRCVLQPSCRKSLKRVISFQSGGDRAQVRIFRKNIGS